MMPFSETFQTNMLCVAALILMNCKSGQNFTLDWLVNLLIVVKWRRFNHIFVDCLAQQLGALDYVRLSFDKRRHHVRF